MRLANLAIGTLFSLAMNHLSAEAVEPALQFVDSNEERRVSQAVIVPAVPLVHTAQLLPVGPGGNAATDDPARQTASLVSELESILAASGSGLDRLVRLHLYAANDQAAGEARRTLADRLPPGAMPAITVVTGALTNSDAAVALDAVASSDRPNPRQVELVSRSGVSNGHAAAILPHGSKIYVSGQAEPGDVAEATRKTLESLNRTLEFLGVDRSHVVQAKSFLTPIDSAGTVREEMQRFFGEGNVPPLVFVEWQSKLPIEIELVVAGRRDADSDAPAIEFLTPPEMKPSPVFCRVTRINSPRTIYTSGLYGQAGSGGEAQVRQIFAELMNLMQKAGSDLRHLAKATYYVSDEEVSAKLNQIRPEFYDPQRPPAASKAMVNGVGKPEHSITLDLIAVPAR